MQKSLSFKYYKSGNEVQLTIATMQSRKGNIRVIYIKKANSVFLMWYQLELKAERFLSEVIRAFKMLTWERQEQNHSILLARTNSYFFCQFPGCVETQQEEFSKTLQVSFIV